MNKLKITDEYAGRRVDRVIKLIFPSISKTLIFKLIRKKKICVNGARTTPNYLLQIEDVLFLPEFEESKEQKKTKSSTFKRNFTIQTLYEDDDLIVIDKESGIAVQPGTGVHTSLVDMLNISYDYKIYPIHRLDRGTSGCIVFAKNYPAARKLSDDLKNKKIQKSYLAGTLGQWQETIKTIDNASEEIKSHELYKYFNDKEATTKLIKFKVFDHSSMVTLMPETGRKHQLRLHLSMLGYPILGDDKYGNFEINKKIKVKRLMLHANYITFNHPKTNELMSIESKSSQTFEQSIKSLDKLL
ncbi:MAG: RluA family pseudouridine synthase [Pseudomonadota bacterium]|nr:RluA family pseudouridine synthase [Pseudomonadota bacterium]